MEMNVGQNVPVLQAGLLVNAGDYYNDYNKIFLKRNYEKIICIYHSSDNHFFILH